MSLPKPERVALRPALCAGRPRPARRALRRNGAQPQDTRARPRRKQFSAEELALRRSVQNLSRLSISPATLMSTRLYKSARHQQRASTTSAAQSTSMPSFRITSARRSRFVCEVSSRSTRFFFAGMPSGFGCGNASDGSGHATFSLRFAGAAGATRCFSARAFNIFCCSDGG